MNILIIEDEIITANDIKKILEQAGHTVPVICKTYLEALKAIELQMPDLILIDIKLKLSGLDGIQIAEQINANYTLPIIYLTSQTDSTTFERAKQTRPAAYLFKPFRRDELVFQIELAYEHYLINRPQTPDPATSSNVFFPYKKEHRKINKNLIQFIKAEGAYVSIYIRDDAKPHLFTMNIGYIEQFFISPNFYKLTRSYIINIDQIERFDSEYIYFENSTENIHVPQAQRQEFLKKVALIKTPQRNNLS
ncbi:MAG: response regulator [Leadbetterella sp.]|nr:response regulator [Leadbetterella sp.]